MKSRPVLPLILKAGLVIMASALGTWMILGSYPIWFDWMLVSKIGFITALFLAQSLLFYFLFTINQVFLRKIASKTHRGWLILTCLVLLATAFLLRHEIPLSFSHSFTPESIIITQQPSETAPLNKKDFDISLRSGLLLIHPFSAHQASSITAVTSEADPIRFVFYKNRFTYKSDFNIAPQSVNRNLTIQISSRDEQESVLLGKDEAYSRTVNFYQIKSGYAFSYMVDIGAFFGFLLSILGSVYFAVLKLWRVLSKGFGSLFLFLLKMVSTLVSWMMKRSLIFCLIAALLVAAILSIFAENSMNSIMWFFSIVSITLTSVLILSALKVRQWTVYLIGFYLLSFCNVLFVTQLSGIMGLLDHPIVIPILHCLILLIAFAAFKMRKNPIFPLNLEVKSSKEIFARLSSYWKSNPEMVVLSLATAICYCVVSLLVILVPSNIDDILTTYLPRAGYWLQQGSFKPWPTSAYNLPQVVYPLNGQLPLAWLISLWGNDQLAGFLQLFSLPVGLVGIYGLGRILGAPRKLAFFSALLFLGLPEVIILSSTALTDLLVANLFAALIFLLIKGVKSHEFMPLLFSALALGISIGIKQTTFFMLPGLAIICLILLLSEKKTALRPILQWAGISLLTFILVGSYSYIQNLTLYGRMLGPSELTPYFTHYDEISSFLGYLALAGSNLAKLIIRAFLDNLPFPLLEYLAKILQFVKIDQNVLVDYLPRNSYAFSVAWAGQIGFVLLLSSFFYGLIHSIKQKKWLLLGLVLSVITYTAILLVIRNFSVGSILATSRYLVTALIVLIPLIFVATKFKTIRIILVINSILMMAITLMFDGAKPLVGPNAIWNKSQNELRNLQLFDNYLPAFETMDADLPQDATIAVWLPDKFPQSYLFGENFTRTVIQLDPKDNKLTLSDLQTRNAEYLLVSTKKLDSDSSIPSLSVINDDPSLPFVIYEVPAVDDGVYKK